MTSRLAQMQARFQQKQMQEKEEKLLKLYENQQQRTIERVSRGSAGSDSSVTTHATSQGGKVRQMFDERRQKAGIDRSYPLEPLKTTTTRSNGLQKPANKNAVRTTFNQKTSRIVVNKRNNDNPPENYHHRYEDDNANELYNNKMDDLVSLMNDQNLNETLDDEQMPNLDIDEVDEVMFTGKLANVGGKLPSQNGRPGERNTKIVNGNGAGSTKILSTTFKKETKPAVIKKTTSVTRSTPKASFSSPGSSQSSQSSTPKTSTPSTPSKSAEMSKKSSASKSPTKSFKTQSAVARDDLVECQFCNRRFASDRLQVHQDICARTVKKKRKTYDALKHRVQGTELEPFVKKKGNLRARPASAGKKGNWRQTHEEFISTIRAAKMAQQHVAKGGKLSDLPPPPPSSNPDYVQCPHCGRRFNEAAAQRHIPKCANYDFNKPKNQPKAAATRGRGR